MPKILKRVENIKLNPKITAYAALIVFSLFLVIALGKLVYESPIFRVREIYCNVPLDHDLEKLIRGKALFTLNVQDIRARILNSHSEFKTAAILKKFPRFLKIDIVQRKPIAQIKKQKFYPIDEEGVILSEGRVDMAPGLILVEITDYHYSLRNKGSISDARWQYAVNLVAALNKKGIPAKFPVKLINATSVPELYFVIDDENYTAKPVLSAGVKVLVGDGNFDRKLYLFENVLQEKLQGDISGVEYIDLRHKKVYLGYRR